MNIAEAIRIALRSLWANKLRSVLTLLGVVIGIAAVIAVVTFVSGIQDYVATKIFNLGADVFIIAKMSPIETNVEHFLVAEKRKNLKLEDYQAVLEACHHCEYVGAMARGSGKVKHNEQSISDTTIQGITPSVASILDTDLTYGRMLNDTDLNNHLQVAVVGTDIVEHLLGGADPLGQEIRVDGWTYQVIGVGKKKGKTLGQSADNYVLIPVTVYLKQYGSHNDSLRVWGKATATGAPLSQAIDEARVALRAQRHDRVGRRRQLRNRNECQSVEHLVRAEQYVFYGDDWHCCGLSGGGRHRDHEHHAGVGHGTYARNWYSQGSGRPARGCACCSS